MNSKALALLLSLSLVCPSWGAVNFDGTDDYLNVVGFPFIAPPVTLSAWIKTNAAPAGDVYHSIVTRGGVFVNDTNYALCWRPQEGALNRFVLYWRNGSTLYGVESSNNAVPVNTWTHVAAVVDSAFNITLYANGASVATDGSNAVPTDGSQPTRIGGPSSIAGGDTYFSGLIDDTRIYNRDLSENEVKSLVFSRNRLWITDGLVGYWRLDEGAPGARVTPFTDEFIGGYTASLTGFTDPVGAHTTSVQAGINSAYALSFDGTNDAGKTDATINLTGTNAVTLGFWLYWRTYGTNADMAVEFSDSTDSGTTGFYVVPNGSTGDLELCVKGDVGFNCERFTRPAANEWHHWICVYDKSQAGTNEIDFYLDNVQQTAVSSSGGSNNTNAFGNHNLNFMARNTASLFGDGIIDEVMLIDEAADAAAREDMFEGTIPPGAVGVWGFENPNGRIFDRSGNGNHGVAAGNPTYTSGVLSYP